MVVRMRPMLMLMSTLIVGVRLMLMLISTLMSLPEPLTDCGGRAKTESYLRTPDDIFPVNMLCLSLFYCIYVIIIFIFFYYYIILSGFCPAQAPTL